MQTLITSASSLLSNSRFASTAAIRRFTALRDNALRSFAGKSSLQMTQLPSDRCTRLVSSPSCALTSPCVTSLALKIRNNEAAANLAAELNHTTREVAHRWWLRLGNLAESGGTPGDPAPPRIFPDPGPCLGGQHYRCGNVV